MNKIFDKSGFDTEDFDDEIILVHFSTGIYFTIKGSGAAIFRIFQNGVDPDAFNELIVTKFGNEKLKEVNTFVAQLEKEKMLIDTDAPVVTPQISVEMLSDPLIFQKFDDIGDLIKLDPIHDVSNSGWPNKK